MSLLKSLFVVFATFAFIAPATSKVGLYVPLYMYLGHYWTELIDLKDKYDDLPVLAIVNPDSGPGTSKDSDFSDGIDKLLAAGIIVHAYIATTEGNRATADVQADIDSYKSFYPQIGGIFFDEMANDAGKESYYTTISAYARSQGFEITHGNPGTNIPKSYADTVNIIVIAETTGTSDLSISGEWATTNPAKLALIATTESSLPKKWVKEACKLVDWVYVTDDIEPNPYDTLPSYVTDLAKVLNRCNNPSKLGMILGIIFGVLGGIAIAIGTFFAVKRYRAKKNMKKATTATQTNEEKL